MNTPTLIGYARPLPGLAVDDAIALLVDAGADPKRVYIDRPDQRGKAGWTERDFCLRALRRGDLLVLPRLSALAANRQDFDTLLLALEAKGADLIFVQDGIDPREGSTGRTLIALGKALRRAGRDWKSSTGQPAKVMRLLGKHNGRPRALPTAVEVEMCHLRRTTGTAWSDLEMTLRARGFDVSASTLRRIYRDRTAIHDDRRLAC